VALGFALLLILGGALGSFAVWNMQRATDGADLLHRAVAPQSRIANTLALASGDVQRAARTYSLTGDATELAEALKHLDAMSSALAEARALGEAQPELTSLRTGALEAETALADYRKAFAATTANLGALADIRTRLDANATAFLQATSLYLTSQDKALAEEIRANTNVEKLENRHLKIELANQIIDLGNSIRVATFKAQALRQPSLIDQSLGAFATIEAHRRKLLSLTVQEGDLRQLADLAAAVSGYQAGVEAVIKNFAEAKEIAAIRLAAMNTLDGVIGNLMNRSIERTTDYAQDSVAGLGRASRLVIGGLLAMVLLGCSAAALIITGINRVLTRTATSLSHGALQVAAASSQVSAASQTLAEGSSEQAASLEEISSSIEELASMTRRNADNAQAGKISANHARTAVEAGAAEMERMQSAMNAIQQSSNDISKIIKTIDEIAFQTNILALNAAVEAARAGEAGAGFAVVADEVRSLAQRSAIAAKETADKISDATTRSSQGVDLSKRVSAGLQEILEKTREVDRLVNEVATASQEQSEGIGQINVAIGQMDKVTQSNAASAEETASAAEELNAQSEELRGTSLELAALVGAAAATAAPVNKAMPAAVHAKPAKLPGSPPSKPKASSAQLSFHG
jgi:methyl-accepting chemotaxis protein